MSQPSNIAWLRALLAWEHAQVPPPGSRRGRMVAGLAAIRSVALELALCADREDPQVWVGQRHLLNVCGAHVDTIVAMRRRWIEHGWLLPTGITHATKGPIYRLAVPCGQSCGEAVPDCEQNETDRSELTVDGRSERSVRSLGAIGAGGDGVSIGPQAVARSDRYLDRSLGAIQSVDLDLRSPEVEETDLIARSDRSTSVNDDLDVLAHDALGIYEVEMSARHGLTPRPYEPGDERRPLRLLRSGWDLSQIRLHLNAAGWLAARFPSNAVLWDGVQTWEEDTLRTALRTYAALAAVESRREDDLGRMPALRALNGGGS